MLFRSMPPTNRRHGAADAPEILRTAESVVAGRISRYTLRELLNKLDEHSVDAEEFSVHTPDLDDVFLALTGHASTEENAR